MNRSFRYIAFCILLIWSEGLIAQVNRYLVHLSDKTGASYTVENPEAYLSQRAIERRQLQDIMITEEDLPVNSFYVNGIKDLGIDVYFTSKWFNAVLVQCDDSIVSQIEALSYVDSVEYVAPGAKIGVNSSFEAPGISYSGRIRKNQRKKLQEASEFQNNLIGVGDLHESGITGEGVLIAIMDGGFYGTQDLEPFDHLYQEEKIIQTYDYVAGTSDVYQYSNHGTKVFSLLGAYDEGEFVGTAYNSNYMLFVTEDDCGDCEHRIEEYNWVFAAEFADSAGVDVINTSLGYNWFEDPDMSYEPEEMDGNTAIISRANDIAFSKGILVVSAAGNEGNNDWEIITAPGDAHNIISVGNIAPDGLRALSSSIGPTADQRIKPDLVALGAPVQVISSSGNIVPGVGTSFSSPQIAGLCALIRQAYPELTAVDIRFLLLETASNASNPDNEIGYGLPNFNSLNNYLIFSDSEDNFLVYPNPVQSDDLVIRVNNPGEIPAMTLRIFNTSGEQVFEKDIEFTWQDNTHIIDMYSYPSGIYIFNITAMDLTEKIRILKI